MSDVRDLFWGIRYKLSMARELSERIEARYASALPQGIRYDKDAVQASGGDDRLADTLQAIEDLKARRLELIDEAAREEAIALKVIHDVQEIDAREAQVLYAYYLREEHTPVSAIAEELHYSERQVFRIYDSAMRHAQDVYDNLTN